MKRKIFAALICFALFCTGAATADTWDRNYTFTFVGPFQGTMPISLGYGFNFYDASHNLIENYDSGWSINLPYIGFPATSLTVSGVVTLPSVLPAYWNAYTYYESPDHPEYFWHATGDWYPGTSYEYQAPFSLMIGGPSGPWGWGLNFYLPDPSESFNWNATIWDTQDTNPVVPEPSSLLLFGTGIAGVVGAIRRKLLV